MLSFNMEHPTSETRSSLKASSNYGSTPQIEIWKWNAFTVEDMCGRNRIGFVDFILAPFLNAKSYKRRNEDDLSIGAGRLEGYTHETLNNPLEVGCIMLYQRYTNCIDILFRCDVYQMISSFYNYYFDLLEEIYYILLLTSSPSRISYLHHFD